MRYLLNSAVITAFGTYTYAPLTPDEARAWYANGGAESTIGYAETAAALSALLGVPIATDRRTITMIPGDEALVFRLRLTPGSERIDPADKGRVGAIVADPNQVEVGLLTRTA